MSDVEQAAVKADPVYEVNGMRIWIQPLDAVPYHLDHDMTLNDFLDRIGILNDPSKQAIYTNPITGATYILNLFDETMPLVDVLDLIGYDRDNLELQFLGNAHRLQVIDTTTILQLQDDTMALFHPDVRVDIFYRHGINDYQRSYFSRKVLDAYSIVKLRFQDTFKETIYESAYNIIKTKYSEDFGITQEEWLELVDSKAKDEHGVFTQEFEKIVDLCLKEQVFLNLIELSGAKDQDVNAIFSTLDTYLDENFGSLIEQSFVPLTFEAFISEVVNQVLNNIDNEGFVSFNVPTQEYFEDLVSVQDSYKDELVSVYWGSPPPPEFKSSFLIEREFNGELDALSLLFYRVREYLMDQSIRDLPITDTLLGLHGPNDPGTYTRLYLTDVFKDLGLIDDNILQNIHLTQKSFYKKILEQIQLDIQNNPDSSKFKDYSFLTGMEFSLDEFFDDGDQQIVKFIDDIMNKEIGYVGYTLFKLDLIRFDGNGQITFQMPQDQRTLTKIIRVLGLNSIAELDTNDIETLIWSIILSGHYMNLMILDNNGKVELRKAYTYPGSQFFTGIFENFMGNIPDSIYHLSIINVLCYFYSMIERFSILNKIPKSWTIFKSEYNLEFYEKLVEFRGNDRDLDYDPKRGGSEGQIFKSDNYEDIILKRWFTKSFWKFERSVRYLEETRNRIETNPELNQYIEVVEVHDQGSDWILRDFYPFSYELRNALKNEEEARIVYDRVIALLSDTTDFYLMKVLQKLKDTSYNLHWDANLNKIIIIDMM